MVAQPSEQCDRPMHDAGRRILELAEEPDLDKKGDDYWRALLSSAFEDVDNYDDFQWAVKSVAQAANVLLSMGHPKATMALLLIMGEMCSPVVEGAEAIAQKDSELGAKKATGRAVNFIAPKVGDKPKKDSMPLIAVDAFRLKV